MLAVIMIWTFNAGVFAALAVASLEHGNKKTAIGESIAAVACLSLSVFLAIRV